MQGLLIVCSITALLLGAVVAGGFTWFRMDKKLEKLETEYDSLEKTLDESYVRVSYLEEAQRSWAEDYNELANRAETARSEGYAAAINDVSSGESPLNGMEIWEQNHFGWPMFSEEPDPGPDTWLRDQLAATADWSAKQMEKTRKWRSRRPIAFEEEAVA